MSHDKYTGAFTNDVSTQRGEGVSEMLTKPDMGGLTNDDVSKKGHFAAIATNTKTRIPNF